MQQYLDLVRDILGLGEERSDRTGTGTISVFGRQLRFDLTNGFPAVTTKKLAWKAVVSELLWFLEGSTNEHRLAEILRECPYSKIPEDKRRTIWTDNYEHQAKEKGYDHGYLGEIYGAQWRNWGGINGIFRKGTDQIQNVINEIKVNPTSRRLLVSAWNVSEIEHMALPPCHYAFQFYVNDDKLSLMWSQRSVDVGCGLPFNIASYALLLHIVAKMTGKVPYELIGSLGDCHIYKNHVQQLREQIRRDPHKLPTLELPDIDYNGTIDDVLSQIKTSDIKLVNYIHDEPIKLEMAI